MKQSYLSPQIRILYVKGEDVLTASPAKGWGNDFWNDMEDMF